MAKKKHKLLVSMDEDYCLLGISSDEPDYRLCWLINGSLAMAFNKVENLSVFHRKQSMEQEFSMFVYEDENTMLTYRLIENSSDTGPFIDELRNIDFLLHIHGEIVAEDISELISRLNKIKEIRMCVPVDLGRIKELGRLQLW